MLPDVVHPSVQRRAIRTAQLALDAADRAEVETQWARLREFFERWFRKQSGEFIAAFQEFATTDEFAGKVEDCLRQWLARRGFASSGPRWDRLRLGSPFPGLAAFDEARKAMADAVAAKTAAETALADLMKRIEQAKQDWRDGKFGVIPGDEFERIPLPD